MSPTDETPRPLQQMMFSDADLNKLRQAGFEVDVISSDPERVRVMKHGCALLLERHRDRTAVLSQKPGFLVKGEIARLWDAGYQKFWLLAPPTDDPFGEVRVPALAEHLQALNRFEDEARTVLGLPSFYNESIGSTNKITAYDRVHGRDSSSAQKRRPF